MSRAFTAISAAVLTTALGGAASAQPAQPPAALQGTKRVLNLHLAQALAGPLQAGFAAEAATMETPDHRDRLLALRKRSDG